MQPHEEFETILDEIENEDRKAKLEAERLHGDNLVLRIWKTIMETISYIWKMFTSYKKK